MGRFLALGVATRIQIEKSEDAWRFDIKSINILKNKILKDMENIIDISKYEITYEKEEDCLCLELKDKDFFNKNIHKLMKELYPLINCRRLISPRGEDVLFDETFTKEKYPFNLIKKDAEFYEELTGMKEEWAPWQVPESFLFKNEKYQEGLHCDIWYIPIWIDVDKIGCESEHYILKLLNIMSRKYIESSLIKIILFYIFG